MVIEINNKPKLENLYPSNKPPNIQVVNGKNTGFIGEDLIYIGRSNKYKGLPQSPLANPYKLGQFKKSEVRSQKYQLVAGFNPSLIVPHQILNFGEGLKPKNSEF